jgi:hypothetical protein
LVPTADSSKAYVLGVANAFAGTVTWTDPAPEVQLTVAGSPVSAGVTENTQLVVLLTFADRVTRPPPDASAVGLALNEWMTGAALWATVTFIGVAVTVLVPTADSPKVYVLAVANAFAGTVTWTDPAPEVQLTVAGNPVSAGVTENTHLVVLLTFADRVTRPPPDASAVGLALNEWMTGAANGPAATSAGLKFIADTSRAAPIVMIAAPRLAPVHRLIRSPLHRDDRTEPYPKSRAPAAARVVSASKPTSQGVVSAIDEVIEVGLSVATVQDVMPVNPQMQVERTD